MAARLTPHPKPKMKWLASAPARRKALKMAASGHTIGQIAQALNVSSVTLLKHRGENPEFEQALLDSRLQAAERVGYSALQALEQHIEAAHTGQKHVTEKKDSTGKVIESTEKPVELNGAMVTAGLRALSSVFSQSHSKVELSGSVDFGNAMDAVLAAPENDEGDAPVS